MGNAVRRPALIGSGLFAALAIILLAMYFGGSARAGKESVVPAAPAPVAGGEALLPGLREAGKKFLAQPVVLGFDGKSITTTWAALGVAVDEQALAATASRMAQEGGKDPGAAFAGGDHRAVSYTHLTLPTN